MKQSNKTRDLNFLFFIFLSTVSYILVPSCAQNCEFQPYGFEVSIVRAYDLQFYYILFSNSYFKGRKLK